MTTRLNVPVVRGRLGFESERSHKIEPFSPFEREGGRLGFGFKVFAFGVSQKLEAES